MRVDLGQRALSGLHERDAVLDVAARLVEAADLTTQLLRDRQASGIVGSAVDAEARRQTLHALGQLVAGVASRLRCALNASTFVLMRRDMLDLLDRPGATPCHPLCLTRSIGVWPKTFSGIFSGWPLTPSRRRDQARPRAAADAARAGAGRAPDRVCDARRQAAARRPRPRARGGAARAPPAPIRGSLTAGTGKMFGLCGVILMIGSVMPQPAARRLFAAAAAAACSAARRSSSCSARSSRLMSSSVTTRWRQTATAIAHTTR